MTHARRSTSRPLPSPITGRLAWICATLIALASIAILSAQPARASEGCANEDRRVEQRATYLPDCRAYEMVSPLQSEPEPAVLKTVPVSLTGERVGFFSQFGPPPSFTGAGPGSYFLSSRGPAGWSTQGEIPRQSTVSGLFCMPYVAGYSADLSKAVLADGWNWSGYPMRPDDNGTTSNCGHDEPLLLPGEPQGAQNIFLHASEAPGEAGFYQLLNLTPSGLGARDAYFRAGSADFSHIVFSSPLQLTLEAPLPPEQTASYSVGEDLYENVGGVLHLVTFLPGGAPTWGILANSWESYEAESSASFTHAVSDDGERVFFYANGKQFCESPLQGTSCSGPGRYVNAKLYLRQNTAQAPAASGECSPAEAGRACTVQVDEKNAGAPGPGGGGQFQSGTPDGSRAFFTDCSRLTADSTAVSSGGCGGFAKGQTQEEGYLPPTGQDLYEYDVEKPVGERLTDLTVDSNGSDSLGADVQGVAGISEDGSYVYFVARGVLTGSEENEHHEQAAAGETNLYLRHAGATTFIATLGPPLSNEIGSSARGGTESCDWASVSTPESTPASPTSGVAPCLTSRVSPDGRFLAFNSRKRLTGYDNTVAASGEPSFEIFRYDAATSELSCASCDPEKGTTPTARETFEQPTISAPLPPGENWLQAPNISNNQLSDDGRVFFSTTNSLLPADVNGSNSDVYEYDGSRLHLISAGTGNDGSVFRNASLDGANVFFTTADALVSSDTDGAISLYDARVGGGFLTAPSVGPGGVVETPACESVEACKPPPGEPPAEPFPASSAFSGAGNLVSPPAPVLTAPKKTIKCPRGKKLSHGKCVKKKPKKCPKHKKLSHGKCMKKTPKKSKPKKSSGRKGSK
jgi:hypothetical protein